MHNQTLSTTLSTTLSILTSLTLEKIPGPLPLYRTASDGKLGGAWERGYSIMITYLQHISDVNISYITALNKVIQYLHIAIFSCQM